MSDQAGMNHITNADRNRNVIMGIVREHSPITRKQVASISGLSQSTTKRIVESLEDAMILVETDRSTNADASLRRGRKAMALRVNSRFAHAIGASIEPGILSVCMVDLEGALIDERKTELDSENPHAVIELVVGEIESLTMRAADEERGLLVGIGVGVAGVVDARSGFVHFCPGLSGWEDTPLGQILAEKLGVHIIVDDSTRCLTLAEKRYGHGHNKTTFAYLYFGRGVGAGLFLDNVLYRGSNGLSGEFGHTTLREGGPLCRCGNRGCLEAIASEEAILRGAGTLIDSNVYTALQDNKSKPLRIEEIGELADDGDKAAGMIVHDVGEDIGMAVANLTNTLDPGTVICGGEVVDSFGPALIETIRRVVNLRGIQSISKRTEIMRSALETSSPRGAATLQLERFFGTKVLGL